MRPLEQGAEVLQDFGPDYSNNPEPLDMALQALDAALLGAHATGDKAALARLYAEAAERADATGDRDRAAFYLTHAYVFALDRGDPAAGAFHARLCAWGREA